MKFDPIMFLNFEENHKMFEKNIYGIHYWPLIRTEVFDHVYDVLLEHDERHPDLYKNKTPQIQNALKLLKYAIAKPHSFVGVDGRILLSMSCKKELDQAYLLIKNFSDDLFYINRPANFSHIIQEDTCDMMYPDGIEILRGIYVTINSHNPIVISHIRDELVSWVGCLEKEYKVSLNKTRIVSFVTHAIFSMKVLQPYFEKKIRKHRPRCIIVGPYYEKFNYALLLAAKKYGIRVAEMQHGAVSKFHIAYNYLQMHEAFMPDIFLFYGDYWKDILRFPDKERIIVCGSIGLENRIKNYRSRESYHELRVLFISQGPYARVLYPLAQQLAAYIEKKGYRIKVCYKLHPSEVNTWNELHPTFNDDRVEIETGDLYHSMELSDFQVGINSTALFEGLAFGLKTFIFDCSFLEASEMKEFCKKGFGTLFSTPEELAEYIINSNKLNYDIDYFWKRNSLKNISDVLKIKINI